MTMTAGMYKKGHTWECSLLHVPRQKY